MSFVCHLPLLSLIAAFVCVVLCSLLPRKAARLCTFLCEGLCFVAGCMILLYASQNGDTLYQMGHLSYAGEAPAYWFNNVIRFGVTEGIFAVLFPAVLFFSILGGLKKLEYDVSPQKEKYYYVLANLALVALLALTYADDIFTGYVFLEISTLASIGLIAIKDKGRTTAAAIRYMIFNLVGSGLYLIGIVLLYSLSGYFMMEKIQLSLSTLATAGASQPGIVCSLALITVGLGIKSGLFPFYFWMADTYGESTTASAGIISGLISKGYLFLLIKMICRAYGFGHTYQLTDGTTVSCGVAEESGILQLLFVLGFLGMIFGSLSAIWEKRVNKMIAYSSAAQIGYIFLAMGLGEGGMVAAVFQMLVHAVTKPLLFLSARGLIEVSDRQPQFRHLRGSGKRNFFAGIGFSLGAMSMIGFPLTAGFNVKYLFVQTALGEGIPSSMLIATIVVIVISTLLNTGYFIHTVITIYSPATETYELVERKPNRPGFYLAVTALMVLNIFLGLSAQIIPLISNGISAIGSLIL